MTSSHWVAARGLIVAAIVATASRAHAHDFWMAPSEHVVAGDRDVTISLFVGEGLVPEEEKPFVRARFARLSHLHAGSVEDLFGSAVEEARPMLRVSLRGEGGHLIAVDRNPTGIELEPRKFEAYLREEGLNAVIAERARLGESSKRGRERYSRYLKTLVQVGGARDETYGVSLGQQLELVPEANPVFVEPGGTLSIVVRFRGQPLPGAQLEAFSKGEGGVRKAGYTTDAAGRVRVAIDRRGAWLIRSVHMVRCESCSDADWESFWAAYTFGSASESAQGASPLGALRVVAMIAAAAAVLAVAYFLRRRRRAAASSSPPGGG
jgi:Domain of unknown function (DUF4198)